MIDEAIGKILGMAMAYLASALGMFVAYVNYRKRTVRADKVMTPAAWAVIAVTILATVAGVLVVAQLAVERSADEAPAVAEAPLAPEPPRAALDARATRPERSRWTWIGIVVPAAIFLFATVVTAGLHRHFSTQSR